MSSDLPFDVTLSVYWTGTWKYGQLRLMHRRNVIATITRYKKGVKRGVYDYRASPFHAPDKNFDSVVECLVYIEKCFDGPRVMPLTERKP